MPPSSRSSENTLLPRAQGTDLNVLEKARESTPLIRVHFPSPSDLEELRIMGRDNSCHMPNHQAWGCFWMLTSQELFFSYNWLRCFSSVQSLSCVRFFVTPWTAAHQASLSITNSYSLPKPMSIESVMPSSHLILCRPLLLQPSIFPSIRVFSSESTLHMRVMDTTADHIQLWFTQFLEIRDWKENREAKRIYKERSDSELNISQFLEISTSCLLNIKQRNLHLTVTGVLLGEERLVF